MISIERKTALILLTVIAATAVMSGIVLSAYSAGNGTQSGEGFAHWINDSADWFNGTMMAGPYGMPHGRGPGRCCFGYIEVSDEFKENVTSIAKNDTDVQNLLNDGYNITDIRPIIKTIVDANGNVVTRATGAIMTLEKDRAGRATVLVDLEQGKVTQIVIMTRTVIDKSS